MSLLGLTLKPVGLMLGLTDFYRTLIIFFVPSQDAIKTNWQEIWPWCCKRLKLVTTEVVAKLTEFSFCRDKACLVRQGKKFGNQQFRWFRTTHALSLQWRNFILLQHFLKKSPLILKPTQLTYNQWFAGEVAIFIAHEYFFDLFRALFWKNTTKICPLREFLLYLQVKRELWNNAASKLIGILFKFLWNAEKSILVNGGPQPPSGVFATRGLQRLEYPQILYLSEFHHIPLMWLSITKDATR